VTRLKEANDNSERLATLADEMAAAKEASDAVADGLQAARDLLLDSIRAREDTFRDK
jgi:hypothetical protein